MRYVQGLDRHQTTLFPFTLDEYISEENPVRFIDAYVDSLDLVELGFTYAKTKETGRKPFNPADLLKLFVYGNLNRVRSGRRLEDETHKNVEVMWLLHMLKPDFKTICDFRKDNKEAIKKVCREFTLFCHQLGLFGLELIAIDGSKFSAVNHSKKAYSKAKLEKIINKIDAEIDDYFKQLEQNDEKEKNIKKLTTKELKDKIQDLKSRKENFQQLKEQLEETGEKQITLTDPDSRIMRTGNKGLDVCYNVQISVDSKHHLIADFDITSDGNDLHQLYNMTSRVKELFQIPGFRAVLDLGYRERNEIKNSHDNNIECYLPESNKSQNNKRGLYTNKQFQYHHKGDYYICPSGQKMNFQRYRTKNNKREKVYTTRACKTCPLKSKCTTAKGDRSIYRWEHEEIIEQMVQRVKENPDIIKKRKTIVEHPFGTIKHSFGYRNFLCKRLEMVKAEMSLIVLSYNIKRVLNIIGVKELLNILAMRLIDKKELLFLIYIRFKATKTPKRPILHKFAML